MCIYIYIYIKLLERDDPEMPVAGIRVISSHSE